jgi:hypothetical protein
VLQIRIVNYSRRLACCLRSALNGIPSLTDQGPFTAGLATVSHLSQTLNLRIIITYRDRHTSHVLAWTDQSEPRHGVRPPMSFLCGGMAMLPSLSADAGFSQHPEDYHRCDSSHLSPTGAAKDTKLR